MDGGHQIRMLRVDGFKHRRHIELNFNPIAVLPRALDFCELPGSGPLITRLPFTAIVVFGPAHAGMRR